MTVDSITTMKLTSQEQQILRQGFENIPYNKFGRNEYIQKLRRTIYQTLPDRLIDLILMQKTASQLLSGFIIENIPIDDRVIGSPSFEQTGADFKAGTLSENIITAFASLLGEPYSIYFEGQELVNNLTPQQDTKYDFTGLGSEVELDFHIENAALQYLSEDDYSPLGIFFLGLRIDENAPQPTTYVADARQALKLLSQDDIELLYQDNFYLNLPYRWRDAFHSAPICTAKCPLIRGPLDLPRVSVAFYSGMTTAVNDVAKHALDNFHQAVQEIAKPIIIRPGNLVYVDNRFTLHSRTKFCPTYDTAGHPYRWLQRVFVASTLWPFRTFQKVGERVFMPNATCEVKNVSETILDVA